MVIGARRGTVAVVMGAEKGGWSVWPTDASLGCWKLLFLTNWQYRILKRSLRGAKYMGILAF